MNKTNLIIICILAATACKPDNASTTAKQTTVVSVLCDMTDHLILAPTPGPVVSLFDFSTDKNKEAYFRMQTITDMQLGPLCQFHLANGLTTEKSNNLGDRWYREKLIQVFNAAVANTVKNRAQQMQRNTPEGHSECFGKIASELHYLKTFPIASKRILLVFSDLKENAQFSCYKKNDKALLKSHPDSVARLLLNYYPIPNDLSGIHICFIYQAPSRENETIFLQMEKIFQSILLERGATVSVQANNTNYE